MRKLPLALACAWVLGAPGAFAMGLGELQTQSYLNQPLRASIPLLDLRPGELETLSIKLGDEAQFARHGYSLMSIYGRIKLQVVGGAHPHVLITSDAPVRDPALGLVFQVESKDGVFERAVSVLLDPEGYRPLAVVKPAPAQPVASAEGIRRAEVTSSVPQKRVAPPPMDMPDGGDYTVVSGDTAYGIAQRVRPQGVSVQQTIDMILQANPHAFANPQNAGTLLAGKTLKIPNAQAMREARASTPRVADKAATTTVAAPSAAQPRLDIVQPSAPAAPVAPAVVAPVVGEVVGNAAGVAAPPQAPAPSAAAPVPVTSTIPVEVQEQIEASKVENERLTGLLASQDERLRKMEELLRLNETLVKELEQKLKDQPSASAPAVPVAVPAESSAPAWTLWLMGLGGLLAAVAAYLFGSRRRSAQSGQSDQASTSSYAAPVPSEAAVAESAVVSPAALAKTTGAAAAAATVTAAAEPAADVVADAEDPIKAALEEVEVMQAYGLHDRAIAVLDEALRAHPDNAMLMARRVRAFHESGDADGFLREAEAFRRAQSTENAYWPEIRALGAQHYPSSPLFSLASEQEGHETSFAASAEDQAALLQPLDGLNMAQPTTVDSATHTEDVPPLEFDMPPLELDMPAVTDLGAQSAATSPAEAETWAPFELPVAEDAFANWSAAPATADVPPADVAEVSAEDLATLGIELPQADGQRDVGAPVSVFNEPEFVEDTPSATQKDELAALDLDFIPSPLAQEPAAAEAFMPLESVQPVDLNAPAFEPVAQQNDALSLDLAPLSLDMPAAPLADVQPSTLASSVNFAESAPAANPSSGVVSEHEVKLDIAAAYIDMGDPQGAREMLHEVLDSHCDELLKARARSMLDQMAG